VTSIKLGTHAASVPAARAFVRSQSHGLPADLRQILELCVSELATNCVLHARTPFTLRYLGEPNCVRIEVSDIGGGTPTMRRPAPTDQHGRGLRIVSALADAWGSLATDGSRGKTVWVEFKLPRPA
jgi:anti-sigma regulatory factor (Ser/Thr protein kinase)